ncbi:acyltransferase [Pseudonocardia acaciae]|uniref:acyltransferase n=1 Tax=Pseudonocardia acaciae TaxID=551276 RepID=UPI000AAFDA82|nr:acyltransferase [Pseudonocardia acaciae]
MSVGLSEHATAVRERTSEPSSGSAAASGAAPARDGRSRSRRLNQIDALRVLSCFSVVAVHALGSPFPIDSVGLGQTSYLLHYSREIFFFVSALVLVRTYYPKAGPDGRLPDESGFRRRRLRLIGIPYLLWTTLYLAVSLYHTRGSEPFDLLLDDLPLRWLYLVVTGNGSYHMYFLLVTLQFTLAFPLVLRLLRRTRGHHGLVLAGSAALQVATLACYHWVLLPDNGWRGLVGDASLLAYQLWLVGGAVVGLHLERWHDWVVRHRALVLGAIPVAATVLMWTFWAQLPSRGGLGASSPLQPIMVLWSVAALGGLYLLAVWIMERGAPAVRAIFSYGAQLSFGVYLAHPMVLDLVLGVFRRFGVFVPSVWVSLAALFFTVVLTVAVCAALHRTPLSTALMGRGRLDPARAPRLLPFGGGRVRSRAAGRLRLAAAPALLLALSGLAVLLVGGDQSAPREEDDTLQASEPAPVPNPGCVADIASDNCPYQAQPEASAAEPSPGR